MGWHILLLFIWYIVTSYIAYIYTYLYIIHIYVIKLHRYNMIFFFWCFLYSQKSFRQHHSGFRHLIYKLVSLASLGWVTHQKWNLHSQELKIRVKIKCSWNRIEDKGMSYELNSLPSHGFAASFHKQVNGALQTLVPVGSSVSQTFHYRE